MFPSVTEAGHKFGEKKEKKMVGNALSFIQIGCFLRKMMENAPK